MATVTREFTFHDHGTFPIVHPVGEEVSGNVEEFAISQGFAGEPVEVEAEQAPAKRGPKPKGK